jgi:hypothetical protein
MASEAESAGHPLRSSSAATTDDAWPDRLASLDSFRVAAAARWMRMSSK